MSRPLTIDELKALEVGDWVWIVIDNEEELCCHTSYYKLDKKIHYDIGIDTLSFTGVEEGPELALSIYGTKWLAYKNKEQAEAEEYKLYGDPAWGWMVNKYIPSHYKPWFTAATKEEAKARLQELRGEK